MKTCTKCNQLKSKSEFYFADKDKGYLSSSCNMGLGQLGDNFESISRMFSYLTPEYGMEGC